jgi:hypothetical protein
MALCAPAEPARAEAPRQWPELKKIHVLLVIDTNSDIRDYVAPDEATMKEIFFGGVPADRHDLKVLKGDDATPDGIIEYYRRLRAGQDEGLVYYYSGHGATIKDQVLALGFNRDRGQAGQQLRRQTLISAMRQKNAGLIVVFTDCCTTQVTAGRQEPTLGAGPPPEGARELNPVMRCLFVQHRGIVDITAATNAASVGYKDVGGAFTLVLNELLVNAEVKRFNASGDFVTWKEFFEPLRDRTNNLVSTLARKAGAAGHEVKTDTQVPQALQLADEGVVARPRWRFGKQVLNLAGGQGVYVRRVFRDTPAERAGLGEGDVIVSIDSQPIRDEDDCARAIDRSDGTIKILLRQAGSRELVSREIKLDRLP